MLRNIILMTRGILLDPRVRRWAMFVLLLAAMVMLFAGTTFLAGDLTMPWGFIIYWGICAWLTFAALMLALWDMLMIRIEARRERRRLEQELAKKKEEDER
jgi:type VI protein secretion system component VasK